MASRLFYVYISRIICMGEVTLEVWKKRDYLTRKYSNITITYPEISAVILGQVC